MDELNSALGTLAAALPDEETELIHEIQQIQSDLFHIGAWLATMPGSPSLTALEEITEGHIKGLEKAIDRMEETLPTLKGFILPGGHMLGAWAHVSRTVCRRAERHVVRLCIEPCEIKAGDRLAIVVTYLNRLSDYLFVLARHLNRIKGVKDTLWEK